MASVYRATDELLGRDVALKLLDLTREDSAARLRAEAAAMARLSHPGIATVYELIEDDMRLVMSMELVRGQTLQHILEQVGVFTPRRAAELCMQALAALEHAHTAGVVHRDLKPANLMLTESGIIKITDFGIARLEGSLNLTSAGEMLGTPAYMAPEQVLGHSIDPRTDLYAMGVVFFRLITAALPFKGETPFEMAQSQVNDTPARASDVIADVPSWVDEILTRALAKKPADRFQSAMEMHGAFASALAETPRSQPVVPVIEDTEVMPRPQIVEPAIVPAHVEVLPAIAESRIEPRTINGWLLIAATLVIGAAAWLFWPRGEHPAPPTTATAAVDTQPVPDPPVPPESQPVAAATAVVTKPITPANTPIASSAPAALPAPSVVPARPPASFRGAKYLAVDGSRTSTSDVLVQFSDGDISLLAPDGNAAQTSMSYQEIAKATYVREKDPKWDPAFSAPAGKIDVPGVLGRARHWLVLQGAGRYLILRLDGEDRLDVLKAFEERAGIVIDRPAGKN